MEKLVFNAKNYFDQQTACRAPDCWSKYTTREDQLFFSLFVYLCTCFKLSFYVCITYFTFFYLFLAFNIFLHVAPKLLHDINRMLTHQPSHRPTESCLLQNCWSSIYFYTNFLLPNFFGPNFSLQFQLSLCQGVSFCCAGRTTFFSRFEPFLLIKFVVEVTHFKWSFFFDASYRHQKNTCLWKTGWANTVF